MARQAGCVCAILCGVAAIATAETIVDLDVAFASHAGTPTVYDHFDDGQLGSQWFVLAGDPGPESGTTLELRPGDLMLAGMLTSPQFNTIAIAAMDLTEFPAGSVAAMFLSGDRGSEGGITDKLVLWIVPGFAILTDEEGLMGGIPIDLGPRATLSLLVDYDRDILGAVVNGQLVFVGDNTLGKVTSLGFFVAPEPTSAVFLALGLSALIRRRRPRRGQTVTLRP